MPKYVELVLTMHKVVLVEVADDTHQSISLAEEVAYDSVTEDVAEVEIVEIHDKEPNRRFDDKIYIEDYSGEDE